MKEKKLTVSAVIRSKEAQATDLYKFLKRRGLVKKFVFNCINHANVNAGSTKEIVRRLKYGILGSFTVVRTPEGSDFWWALHRKYNELRTKKGL